MSIPLPWCQWAPRGNRQRDSLPTEKAPRSLSRFFCFFMFNVVLVEPEIPPNTGNIGRLCLATGSVLHLVKPLGFAIDDRTLKRAGLDYWKEVKVRLWDSFEE